MASTPRSRSHLRRATLLGALLVLVSACGGASETATSAASGSSSSNEPTNDATETLQGEFGTLGGSQLDLASLQGEDVVLWMWAPW